MQYLFVLTQTKVKTSILNLKIISEHKKNASIESNWSFLFLLSHLNSYPIMYYLNPKISFFWIVLNHLNILKLD